MQHRMTVRADRPQLFDRIDIGRAADLERCQVVHVDISGAEWTVDRAEVHATYAA
jgi:hypothetical protein